MFCCGQHNSAVKTWFATDNTIRQRTLDLLRTTQFDTINLIRRGQHNSAANTWFTADNTIRQRTPDSLQTTEFGSETWFTADYTDSLRTTQFGNEHLIRCGQQNSAAKTWFAADNTNSVANIGLLRTTQFQQRTLDSLRTTKFGSEQVVDNTICSLDPAKSYNFSMDTHANSIPAYTLSLYSYFDCSMFSRLQTHTFFCT
jgi:hypothetical protein